MHPTTFSRALLAVCFFLLVFIPQSFAGKLEFGEVWAFLMNGEERFFDPSRPITDIGYFGAGVNSLGKLAGIPDRGRIKQYGGRVHLVVAVVDNYAITHFCLDPQYALRDQLALDIVRGAQLFDGVQIDFESVLPQDYENFYSFLSLLKAGLGEKILGVALPAAVNEKQDCFGYARVAAIADRVVIMAYDEHWSGSEPGPVASLGWCRKVSSYALSKIPVQKLVMGAPFYGRAWADKNLSRAYKYAGMASLVDEKQIGKVERREGIPFVEYVETVGVKVYFEDAASACLRLSMYRKASVDKVAFWRLGQEDPAIWENIAITVLAPESVWVERRKAEKAGIEDEFGLPSLLRHANRSDRPVLVPR
jgi:spore germination protein YaaH